MQYSLIHRLETNKLRNVAKFFGHLLGNDALSWDVFQVRRCYPRPCVDWKPASGVWPCGRCACGAPRGVTRLVTALPSPLRCPSHHGT